MFDIGSRIREIRKSLNMTTTELAEKLDVSQSFISGLENNTKKCSMDNLFKICEIFGVTLSQFFDDNPRSIILTSELKELITNAKNLTPEQLQKLNDFIKVLR